MLKRKVENAREEVQLKLQDNDLETAKKIMKALGCATGNWMHRLSEIYTYNDIEWSLVIAPNNIRYYEAEIAVDNVSRVAEVHARLESEAQALGLDVLDDVGTRGLIHQLDTEANKVVNL